MPAAALGLFVAYRVSWETVLNLIFRSSVLFSVLLSRPRLPSFPTNLNMPSVCESAS